MYRRTYSEIQEGELFSANGRYPKMMRHRTGWPSGYKRSQRIPATHVSNVPADLSPRYIRFTSRIILSAKPTVLFGTAASGIGSRRFAPRAIYAHERGVPRGHAAL